MRITQYDLFTQQHETTLVKERAFNYDGEVMFSSPQMIADLFIEEYYLNKRAEEHVYLVAFNAKNRPVGVFLISKGAVDSSILTPREVMIRVLMVGAKSFAVVHNHPSGMIQPSKADNQITKTLKQCSDLMNVCFLDHIIVANECEENEIYSYGERTTFLN